MVRLHECVLHDRLCDELPPQLEPPEHPAHPAHPEEGQREPVRALRERAQEEPAAVPPRVSQARQEEGARSLRRRSNLTVVAWDRKQASQPGRSTYGIARKQGRKLCEKKDVSE